MPMLIGKFHKLIQSRLLWGVFLVIIVFSFVIWGTPFLFASRSERERGVAGTLDGKNVSRDELWNATMHIRAAVALSTGRMPPVTEETEPTAWRRIASMREAERLGFAVSETEVQDAIRTQPVFQQGGQFNLDAYRGFLGRILGETGLGERFFEEHIRQEILLQKLQMLVTQAVLAPPADIERIYSVLEDQFKVEYIEMKRDVVAQTVSLSDADIQAFFDKDPSRYEIPPKVSVKYVHLGRTAFLDGLSEPDADAIEEYYDEHRAEFTVRVPAPAPTNAVADATNAAPETVEQLRPLAEVKDTIVKALRGDMAMNRAEQAAADFVNRIAPERREAPIPFEDAAKLFKLEVKTTVPFAREGTVAGIRAGTEFNRAAFSLHNTPDEYFSNPVRGEDGYYVLALAERFPARIPKLDEVKAEVTADAREDAIEKALHTRAEALIADVKAGKTTLADAAKAMGLTVHAPPPFSATGKAEDNPHAEQMLPELATCSSGEFAPVLRTFDDTLLVIQVAERIPASRGKLADMRNSIADLILREREGAFRRAFEEHLLDQGHFEDRSEPRKESNEESGG